jgi:hypothetical protein
MKYLIKSLVLFASMWCVLGCNYGEETLKLIHSDTIYLIEKPNGSVAKKMLSTHEKEGWFFIPQVILRPHEDKAWLAIRVYSYGSELNYTTSRTEVLFPKKGVVETDNINSKEPRWYPAENGWFYQVVKVKSYSYSSLISSGISSASVVLDLHSDDVLQSETFDLEVKKVRRSGW